MEEENGLTIGDVFKVILKRIWWVVGAVALCVLVMVLVTQLWYNKGKQYYSVSYEIIYPDSASGKYPNGNEFIIADSISLETLTDIKNGKYSPENPDEFKSVKVDTMLEKDDIRVSQSMVRSEDDSVTKTYTLTVMAKYFDSEVQAVSFLKTVASYPVNRVNAIIAEREYWLNLTTYERAKTYEDKIAALQLQKDYLQSSYNLLRVYDNQIDVKLAELYNLFTEAQKQALTDRLKANFYVLDTKEYIANADYRKAVLNKNIEENKEIIKALKEERDKAQATQGGSSSATTFAAGVFDQDVITNAYDYRIAALTATNASYSIEIENINKTLEKITKYTQQGTPEYAEKQEFDALLEKYRSELTDATEELKTETNKLYLENSRVIFAGNRVERLGGIGAIVSALIGLLGGAVVSGIVICIIDLPKYKRAKLAAAVNVSDTDGKKEEDNESAPEAENKE